MIELRTLGALDLRDADGDQCRQLLANPKRLGVLVYLTLATPRGSHRRDTLLGLFWPEVDQDKARHALRQTIHYLRSTLGADVLTSQGDGAIGVDPARLSCDAIAFEAALDAGQPAAALEAYAGDLLPGFFLAHLSEFERWLESERDRLRRRAATAAWQLADGSLSRHEPGAAEHWARQAVAFSREDEGAVRKLITLLDRTGNRAGALRVYDEFAARLDEEFSAEPSVETRELVAALRQRDVPRPPIAPPAVAPTTTTGAAAVPTATLPRAPVARWSALRLGVVALAAGILALAWLRWMRPADVPTIAVLPFTSLGADSSTSYFADGVTDGIADALGRISGVRVTAHRSSFQFRGATPSARDIGQRLGVSHLVEGSVQREGDRLTVATTLIDTRSGDRLWSQRYDVPASAIFAVQDSITRSVLRHLGVDTRTSGRAALTPPTTSLAAYDAYLLGRFYFNARSPSSLQKAVAYFSMAIDRDSAFARAYAGLAETYSVILTYIEAPPDAVRRQAEDAAHRALALDDRLAEAHTALAVVHANTFDWAGAEQEYERAILLDPNDATAHLWHSQLLQTLGREREQLQEVHRAAALDPLSVVINFSVASAFYTWRRYDEAEQQVQRTLALDPTFPFTHIGVGMLLTERHRYDEAIAEIQRGLALEGPQPITVHVAILARTEALAGRHADAEQLLAGLQARSSRGVVSPTAFAIVYASLGRTDDAFVWLAQAAQERDPQLMLFFPTPPIFDTIRSDPRFERIKALSGL